MIEHYFKFEKLGNSKAKTRFDLTAYTMPVYEGLNEEFIYLTTDTGRINAKEQADQGRESERKHKHIKGDGCCDQPQEGDNAGNG